MENKTERITYYLAVYKDAKKGYWTTFADFECLVDQGDTVEDAIRQSTIFLDAVAEEMVKSRKEFPKPSSVEEFKKKLDPADGEPVCIAPVTVYPPARTQRINITGKGNVFAKIDDYARKRHMTRSELMIDATLDYIRSNP